MSQHRSRVEKQWFVCMCVLVYSSVYWEWRAGVLYCVGGVVALGLPPHLVDAWW